MTVYITQNPMRRNGQGDLVHTHDLTPARKYGDLEVLLPSGPVKIEPGPTVAKLRRKLARFTEGDWLLCLGDPVVIAAASAIIANMNDGIVPLLVWDRHLKEYLSIRVDTFGRENMSYHEPLPIGPDPMLTGIDVSMSRNPKR